MRLIAGKFKGRSLIAPKNSITRPTSSKLRETVFNILQTKVEHSHFLELFAGSGAIGFEALSRHANDVCFVENNKEACECIKKNAQLLDVKEQIQLYSKDVLKALPEIAKKNVQFDIIYADPPYNTKIQENFISLQTVQLIDQLLLVSKNGICLIEEGFALDEKDFTLNSLLLKKIRKSGNTYLHEFHSIL